MRTRACAICKRELDVTAFAARRDRGRDELQSRCRECCAIKHRAWYEKNKLRHERGEVVIPSTKHCWKCGDTKSSDLFGRSKNHADGLNPSCRSCASRYAKQYAPVARMRDPRGRACNLWRSYRLRMDEYLARLEQQQYLCPICGLRVDERFTPQVDHDHYSGKVRDVLCRACNTKLAGFEKRIAQRPEFMRYLEKHDSGVLMAHRPKDTWGL